MTRTDWWLLCSIRARIRNGELDISEDFFLTCLYPKGYGNPNDVEKYFLRSSLLVKVVFCFVSGSWNWFAEFPDILRYLHLSFIFWGIRRTRIWWWTNSEEAEDSFTKEGDEEYCGKSSPYGRQGHSEGNRICGNAGIVILTVLRLVIYVSTAHF